MKKLFGCLVFLCVASVAPAQSGPTAYVDLSIDQQNKISEMVANIEPRPLTNIDFTVALGAAVPPDVALHPLPRDAEILAPQLTGDSYIAVEELVAIVDTGSRRIVNVMQRMRRQGR
ncbi:MAG: DUF1236 domain-containing protein [Sphingobacteriales bacterium]|jgi:hypothetical protein